MDLTAHSEAIMEDPRPGEYAIDPGSQQSIDRAPVRVVKLPITLWPNQRILLTTEEILDIPLGCIGHICLRSTFARLGLLAPPTVADPGFHGSLTLEIYNASGNAILIKPGVAMWSLHYLTVFGKEGWEGYQGKYQGQRGVTLPKAI